jgi:hypothetical protein
MPSRDTRRSSFRTDLNGASGNGRRSGRSSVRIPTKPAVDSDQYPATHSDFIPAWIPI